MSHFRSRHLMVLQQAQQRERAQAERTGLEHVRLVLEGTRPATWVFTGDTIVQGGGQTGAGRTFSEQFGDLLKNKLRRLLDVIVNTGVPNSRCENFLKTFDWRVTRFEPEAVFLMLGSHEATSEATGRDRFYDQLHDIVDAFESAEIPLILQTPPTAHPDHLTEDSNLSANVAVLREVAVERHVALIDHWSLFQNRLTNADSAPDWWSAAGLMPNVRGHAELARQLVEALNAK